MLRGTGLLGGSITGAQQALGVSPSYPLQLPKWRSALANVKSSGGNARMLLVGDSWVFGAFSTGAGDTGDLCASSISVYLQNILTARGTAATENACSGSGKLAIENRAANDARFVLTGGWVAASTNTAVGGDWLQTTAVGTLSFTPRINWNTAKIWYPTDASGGNSDVNFNGGATALTINMNGANGWANATVSTTLGANTINLVRSTGTNWLGAIECWDSTKSQVIINNAGGPGMTTSNWLSAAAPYSAFNAISAIAGDLIIICLGMNDMTAAVPVATYTANMQSLITKYLTFGCDVALASYSPVSTGSVSQATQDAYFSALQGLAAANNILLIDNYTRLVSYTSANSLGYMGHVYHPNKKGYAELATSIGLSVLSGVGA